MGQITWRENIEDALPTKEILTDLFKVNATLNGRLKVDMGFWTMAFQSMERQTMEAGLAIR